MLTRHDILLLAIPALGLFSSGAALAQNPPAPLTLEQVLQLAERRSESIAFAAAGVQRAEGEQARARSGLFPQLSLSASYDRALASEFEGIFDGAGGDCPPFAPDPAASLEARVTEIERALDCGGVGGLFGGSSSDGQNGDSGDALPFGRANTWRLNLSFSQNLFSGGRITAERDLAAAGRESAGLALTSARAALLFDVTQAFYDAALSDRLVTIAEETQRQAEATLRLAQVRFNAGTQPEFEVLRARVARDNLTPQVVRQRAQRQIAYLRLKQLLDLDPDAVLQLSADLTADALPPPPAFAPRLVSAEAAVTAALLDPAPDEAFSLATTDERVVVREAESAVRLREASARLTEAQRRPSVTLTSQYGRVGYPSGVFPSWNDFRSNWTIGAGVQWPILTGGRQRAEEAIARAELEQARITRRQTGELATLDTRSTWAELVAARAAWESSAGTVAQAVRAYQIAETRYDAGVSTQLELTDARLLLVQAEANRAQAARDLQVARARVALLPDLPLGTGQPAGGRQEQISPQQTPSSPVSPQTPVAGQFTSASSSQTGGFR